MLITRKNEFFFNRIQDDVTIRKQRQAGTKGVNVKIEAFLNNITLLKTNNPRDGNKQLTEYSRKLEVPKAKIRRILPACRVKVQRSNL